MKRGSTTTADQANQFDDSMRCPACDKGLGDMVQATPLSDGTIRRMRVCGSCGHQWGTIEVTGTPREAEDTAMICTASEHMANAQRLLKRLSERDRVTRNGQIRGARAA